MSNWQSINKAGSTLITDHLQDAPAIRNARIFLSDMAVAFAKECVSYYDIVGEFQFMYRERQLHSALVPAIAKVADAILMEQPVSRKFKNISSHGWLDYWVAYHSSIFLIEIKHSWNAIKTENLRSSTQELWKEALEQLKEIPQTDVKNISFGSSSQAKVALMVVPFYQASKDENKLQNYKKEETAEIYKQFLKEIKPAPDWSFLWHLHKDLQVTYEYVEQRFELYPCVSMIAKVESVNKSSI